MLVRLSVRLSVLDGVHCAHTVQFSADLSLRLNSPMFWDTKACLPTPSRLFQFHLEERWNVDVQSCKLGLDVNTITDK